MASDAWVAGGTIATALLVVVTLVFAVVDQARRRTRLDDVKRELKEDMADAKRELKDDINTFGDKMSEDHRSVAKQVNDLSHTLRDHYVGKAEFNAAVDGLKELMYALLRRPNGKRPDC